MQNSARCRSKKISQFPFYNFEVGRVAFATPVPTVDGDRSGSSRRNDRRQKMIGARKFVRRLLVSDSGFALAARAGRARFRERRAR
jgi:hypothetical protein